VIFHAEDPGTRWRSYSGDRSALALAREIAFRPASRRYSNQQTLSQDLHSDHNDDSNQRDYFNPASNVSKIDKPPCQQTEDLRAGTNHANMSQGDSETIFRCFSHFGGGLGGGGHFGGGGRR
jgi:hypothetical protein